MFRLGKDKKKPKNSKEEEVRATEEEAKQVT